MPTEAEQQYYTPPQEIEAEQMILGACLLEPKEVLNSLQLKAEDFYKTAHRRIFEAMRAIHAKGEDVDTITVSAALVNAEEVKPLGGPATYLSHLLSIVPTAANAQSHERLIVSASQRRGIIRACREMQEKAYNRGEPENIITDCIGKMNDIRRHDHSTLMAYADLMVAGFNEIERRFELKRSGKLAGIPTGFVDLDRRLHGFQPQLYVLAGASGMGKSALADQFVRNAAAHLLKEWGETLEEVRPPRPGGVGVISLEMGPPQLSLRAISSMSDVPLSRLLAGTIHDNDWNQITRTVGKAQPLPIYCEFTAFSDREIERTIDYMVQQLGCRMVLFDYLQLAQVEDHEGTREQEVTRLSRLHKFKVKQHNIPHIIISSLNKSMASRQDKRPLKSDLRESGNIEFDADVIMFVYRDEVYHCKCPRQFECSCGRRGKAEVIVSKGRMEGEGTVELEWHTNTTTFRDVNQ